MSDISNPIIENALQGNLVELSHRNEQTHLQIRTLNEMVVNLRKENTKLRELLRNALTYIDYEGCGVECPETGHGATLTPCDICNHYETDSCAYVIAQSARELVVEAK